MKLIYFNQNIKLPETFNHPDVIVEIPFEFGYVNYFPYSKQAEAVVDFDKISKFEKILITNKVISHAACEALSCLDKRMKVKDLNKGYVKLDAYFFCGAKYTSYWDGEHIKVVFKDFKEYEYMLIKPTDDVYVTVVDENTLKFD